MEKENLKNTLREIVDAGAENMTAETRKIVRDTCTEFGIELKNTKCKNCYIDAAVLCYTRLEQEMNPEVREEQHADERAYVLKYGVDVLFNGMRINAATMTDDLGARLIAAYFPRNYFEKLPQ